MKKNARKWVKWLKAIPVIRMTTKLGTDVKCDGGVAKDEIDEVSKVRPAGPGLVDICLPNGMIVVGVDEKDISVLRELPKFQVNWTSYGSASVAATCQKEAEEMFESDPEKYGVTGDVDVVSNEEDDEDEE
jgi:hypothetical protein